MQCDIEENNEIGSIRGKTITNSPLLKRKINTHVEDLIFGCSKQVSFVVIDKVDGIVKLLEVILLILFGAITFLAD